MVKNYILGFCLLFLIISCSKKEFIRLDSMLVHQNILDTISINFDSIEHQKIINDTVFSANYFANIKSKIEIDRKSKEFLIREYFKMCNNYYQLNYGADFQKTNYFPEAQHLYYCGKVNLNKNIESLMYLYTYDMGFDVETFETCVSNELLIYNFKKKRLCSIVIVSDQVGKENKFHTGLLSCKINNFLLTYNNFTSIKNESYCHYTSFYIDDIGFVKFQWMPFKEISNCFNDVK